MKVICLILYRYFCENGDELGGKRVLGQPPSTSEVNRRYILISALLLGVGVIFVKMVTLFSSFLRPPVKPNSYGGMMRFGTLAELPPPDGAPEHVSEGRFWLVHEEDGISALHSSCTHLDCLFTWDNDKGRFVCPCHGSEFAKDGSPLKGPATRSLDRFPVSLVGEDSGLIRGAEIEVAASVPVKDLLRVGAEEGNGEGNQQELKVVFVQVDTGRKVSGTEKAS